MIEYLPKFNSNEDKLNKKKEVKKVAEQLLKTNNSKKLQMIVDEIMFIKDTYSINYDIKIVNAFIE